MGYSIRRVVRITAWVVVGLVLALGVWWAAPVTHEPLRGPSIASPTSLPSPDSIATIATVHVGSDPGPAAYDIATGLVYVPNSQSDNVSVIDGSTIISTISVGTRPDLAVYDPGNGYVYVVNLGSENLSVIDGTTVVASISVGPNASFAVYDSGDTYVYIGSQDGNVTVVENTSAIAILHIGGHPRAAAYDGANGFLYVIAPGSNASTEGNVAIIQGLAVQGIVYGGLGPEFLVYDDVSNLTYVVNSACPDFGSYGCGVSVISGESYRGSVNFTSGTNGYVGLPAVDESNGMLYVPNHVENAVYVVNGTAITTTVLMPPQGINNIPNLCFYVPVAGEVYVTNLTDFLYGNVTIINGTSVVGEFQVGNDPTSMVYDTADHSVYVTNSASNSVSVVVAARRLPVRYPVMFTESGLPSGTNWSVSLNETTQSSMSSTIAFNEPNGTYHLYPWDVKGYTSYVSVSTLHVNGTSIDVTVSYFPPRDAGFYYVTFVQTGLPFNDFWTVNICAIANGAEECGMGQNFFGPTHNPTGIYGVRNGTYAWTASPSNITEFPIALNYPFPSRGQVTVNGSSLLIQLTFRYSYPFSFVSVGLPSSTSWTLQIFNETFTASGGVYLNVEIPNGTHAWNATAPGYQAENGTISMQGGRGTGSNVQEIDFQALPPPFPWVYVTIGVVGTAAIVGVAVVLILRLRRR